MVPRSNTFYAQFDTENYSAIVWPILILKDQPIYSCYTPFISDKLDGLFPSSFHHFFIGTVSNALVRSINKQYILLL